MAGPNSPTDLVSELTVPDWATLALVGSGLLALGSVQPWITLTVSENLATAIGVPPRETAGGLGGDGLTSLFFALLVVAVVLFSAARSSTGPGRGTAGLCLFSGLAVGFVAYAVYADARATRDRYARVDVEATIALDVHASLFVIVLGALVLASSGAIGLVREW